LFQSVVQFDANILQKGGGSGLGLFISNAIMQRHPGGRIGVMPGGVEAARSAGDEGGVQLTGSEAASSGCLFFIEMEGYMTDDDDDINRDVFPYPSTLSATKTSANNKITLVKSFAVSTEMEEKLPMFGKVLVVEDSKFNRKMMAKVLSPYAREIVMAEDGVEAVAAVRESMAKEEPHYDVIFMDSLMPNMNGIDATKIILKELKFPNAIIAVTGNMLPEDVREFEDAGVLAVLGKPLELNKLDEVLKRVTIY
jgi:CheY-like chemotaxis protein